MNRKEVLFQIAKMIASGEIPNKVYDKYLSDCPIGFMDADTLFNYLFNNISSDDFEPIAFGYKKDGF